MTTVVAYQGEPGAFSEAAILALSLRDVDPLPCRRFEDVIAAVESGQAAFGMLPTENSLAGPVADSIAAISSSQLVVTGRTSLAIHLALLAVPGAAIETLRSVESHPVALKQCRRFLAMHPQLAPIERYDTAGAARDIAASDDLTRGAIAALRAGELNGLTTLATGLEDRSDNVTQFAIVARELSPILLRALDGRRSSANLER